jgi:hypothetical protein
LCADDVNILGGILHPKMRKRKALSIVSKEVKQEVNANKTKYLVIFREQDSERNYNTMTDINSFENTEVFKFRKKLR